MSNLWILQKFFSTENKKDDVKYRVSLLGKKFIYGESTEQDLTEWERVIFELQVINDVVEQQDDFHEIFFYGEVIEIFNEYLLKHFPEDERVLKRYMNAENVAIARYSLYKTMMVRIINEALPMLKNHELKEKIGEFLSEADEYGRVFEKQPCTEEKLLTLVHQIRNVINDEDWNRKVKGLDSFTTKNK